MNVEVMVITFLKTKTSFPVSGEVPKTLPDKFITIERTSGGRNNMVLDLAEVLISVYSKNSKLEAANEADSIADSIPGLLVDYENITRASVNSVIQSDDTVRGYRRYLVYVDVFNRR